VTADIPWESSGADIETDAAIAGSTTKNDGAIVAGSENNRNIDIRNVEENFWSASCCCRVGHNGAIIDRSVLTFSADEISLSIDVFSFKWWQRERPRFDLDIVEEEEVGKAEKAFTLATDEDNRITIGASEATAMTEKIFVGIVSFTITTWFYEDVKEYATIPVEKCNAIVNLSVFIPVTVIAVRVDRWWWYVLSSQSKTYIAIDHYVV
jgi:hypothetical protein